MMTPTVPRSPWMNAELELFRGSVRRFVAEEILPNQARWSRQQHVDRELWVKAGEIGLLAADVPEEFGGSGGTFAHVAVLLEELAYAGEWGFGLPVHSIVSHYIVRHGTDEQKRRYLPRLASGYMIGAIAMTEPGTGSDLRGIQTRAVKEGENYVINGAKTFISNGSMAGLIIVVAKTGSDAGGKALSLLLLETQGAAGFRVGRILDKVGQKSADTSELFFDNVRVPAGNLLGGCEGVGLRQLMAELPYERTEVAVGSAATIEAAVKLTVEYARERKVFGQSLLDLQNTRFKLAEAQTTAVVARVFIDHCIQKMIDNTMDAVTASQAKLWMTESQGKVVDECLQLFGGYGYMTEYPIGRMYADARVQRIYGGTSEIMKEIIARSL